AIAATQRAGQLAGFSCPPLWQVEYQWTLSRLAPYAPAASTWSACLTSSTSISIVISPPTTTPPVSRTAFQVRPQSLRLILVCALKPATVVPHGLLTSPVYSTSSTTARVTP